MNSTRMPIGESLAYWASRDPGRASLTDAQRTLSRRELDELANGAARLLAGKGVGEGDIVTIALPNEASCLIATFAAWKLGAIPQTLSPRITPSELKVILDAGSPRVVIGELPSETCGRSIVVSRDEFLSATPTSETTTSSPPPYFNAPVSGGSTGRPKVILVKRSTFIDPHDVVAYGMTKEGVQVTAGRLSHNAPLLMSTLALAGGCHVVLLPRFDPEDVVQKIAAHRADWIYLAPTMMLRILKLEPRILARHDIRCLRQVFHTAAPCPAWLKQAWIDWLGPEKVLELYGSTELGNISTIRGDEWLVHRGSVGRPRAGVCVRIADDKGVALPPGQIGTIYSRNTIDPPDRYTYLDDTRPERTADGWESVGDMGWLDEDGYLYLADRRTDMILSGGINIYPAEVEAALDAHPVVRSSAVIGIPDEEYGNVVHAIVDVAGNELTAEVILEFLRERLTPYKLPRTIEFTNELLRDDAGKVRRSELKAARILARGAPSM